MAPRKAYQSPDMVKVSMPSVLPSKRELATLSDAEIKAGLRLRYAWEIAVMGEGQQVVLPPSTHPDSGKGYAWLRDFKPRLALDFDTTRLPAPNQNAKPKDTESVVGQKANLRTGPKSLDDFQLEPVELSWAPIPEKIKAMIVTGEGVEDRSAMLLPVSAALLKAGLTRNEVLSVLTDPDTFLGACAYDHAKTKDRMAAARWVYRYTLARVEFENSGEGYFSAPIVDAPKELPPEKIQAQQAAFDKHAETNKRPGFYFIGDKGGLVPDYKGLLTLFKTVYPFKTIADMKSVFVFDKTHYRYFSPIEVKSFAEDNFNPAPSEKTRLEFLNKVLANNVKLRSFFMATTENKINFKNGILVLDEGFMGPELVPHSPDVGFRGVLPYDYDPKAECPFFDKWVNSIMLGDKELVAILQEFMGYIVRGGDYKYHKALWLGGKGRNGKSTFIDLLKALIGSGNFSTISIKSLVGDKFAGADLDGKIANFSEETSPQELADSGPFKNLTGDGEIYAQKKYGDPYSFRNRAKLIMTYNTIPDLKDLSPGMLSRPLIVPFRKVIADEKQDRSIKQKLFDELPGIFNFALRGWDRLESQNDFTKSAVSKQALKSVREESCNVYQWVENYITFEDEVDPYNPATPRELYEAYCKKERYPYKAIEFYRRLKEHVEMSARWKKLETGNVYLGVKIHG
jgi:P4 family phage/plasmid primase-like protien